MLQKFALAFKTKTFEFFADEDDDGYDAASAAGGDLSGDAAPEEVIIGQRVVVLKPDPPPRPDPLTLLPSLLAAASSFRAAYLHLQTAHSPFDPTAISSADRAAVSHLRRLSDLKASFFSTDTPTPSLSSHLQAQVQDNQTLLRTFDAIINRLQSDIDRRDAEAAALKQTLRDIDTANLKLERRLERACSPADDRIEAHLSVSVFDSVLRDSYRATHHFTRSLIALMKQSGLDSLSAANSIYPDAAYAKPGHCQYAILSYICLGIFEGFDSEDFSCGEGGNGPLDTSDVYVRRTNSLRQFIEHSAVDPLELLNGSPKCGFAVFCDKKYEKLFNSSKETTLFGNSVQRESVLQSLSSLYEPFVSMASSVWMLHKLALAYNPVVDIFQVWRGADYSEVYMERVIRTAALSGPGCEKSLRQKVGFTVVPGFRVGQTVIQCRVYLNGS